MIQVDELLVKVSGMQEEQAAGLGQQIAELVRDRLPDSMGEGTISELKVRMPASSIAPGTDMASAIADRIIQQIKLVMYG